MTPAEIGAEQVINWRRNGLEPGECMQAMGYPPDGNPTWRAVAGVVAYESERLHPAAKGA
jgi:hypothetical protein